MRFALFMVLAFAAGLGGVYVGRLFGGAPTQSAPMAAFVDQDLGLDGDQRRAVQAIRTTYEAQHMALHAQMRRDNEAIAEAFAAEGYYDARVAAAVDRLHRSMGNMEKVAMTEMFATRAILRPDQRAKFNQAVHRALTQGGR